VLTALLVVLFVREAYIQGWPWTGFVSSSSSSTDQSSDAQPPKTKTLWDWMDLLSAMAIPLVVGFGVARFSQQQQMQAERASTEQHRTNIHIAADQAQETLLNAYIDRMSDLLLDPKRPLALSKSGDASRVVARARTLEVLSRLDGTRKAHLLNFLNEAKVIEPQEPIISLASADLRGLDVHDVSLYGANLSFADLSGANLRGADLRSDLSGANLNRADLSGSPLWRSVGESKSPNAPGS
jgi:hypothetical protein